MSMRQRAGSAITSETRKEGREMTTQTSKAKSMWSEGTRMLAGWLLLAALMASCLMLVANPPAQAATNFTVNSTGDQSDADTSKPACDVDSFTTGEQCTLRAAIQQANATVGADTINFNIPGTGVKTIAVNATGHGQLPVITEQVTIDGYTQAGAHPNTKTVGDDASLKIVLDGSSFGGYGLVIENTSNSVIKGLVINRFGGSGIYVSGDSVGDRIEGNFVGTDPTGTLDMGNGDAGVSIYDGPTKDIVVGGTTPAARNLISGNRNGVQMGDGIFGKAPALSHLIQGNYIGTDKSGTKDLGNDFDGIFLDDTHNITVGGTTAASRNVVSGNGANGLTIHRNSTDAKVLGNRIGTTADGKGALGNTLEGVAVSGSHNILGNITAPNTIAFNGGEGINVSDGTGNLIDCNSIFSNAGIGIDLSGGMEDAAGRTANDPGDADTGSNGLQNFPVITSAKTASDKTTIEGELNTLPNDPAAKVIYDIQFFSNPPGGDEGKTRIGQTTVNPDPSGNATFTFSPSSKVAAGRTITAVAQAGSPVPTDDLNTSEFSAPTTVKDATPPTVKQVAPSENAMGVSPSANVSAFFSEAMDPSTVNATTVSLRKAGTTTKLAATITYDAATKKAILNPNVNLKAGAGYLATVSTGAKDVAGNALDQDSSLAGNQAKSWKFTVRK
jgi:CSLREA domain-containing protein